MYDITTFGTVSYDVFLKSDFKILKDKEHLKKIGIPEGEAECFALGSKIDIHEAHMMVGGGASNTGVTFARQGLRTRIIGKIGDDAMGKMIAYNLEKEGTKILLRKEKKELTAFSTILLAPNGERVVLVFRGASEHFKSRELSKDLFQTKWLYIVPGTMDFSLIKNIVLEGQQRKVKIAMNPSRHFIEQGIEKMKPILVSLDVLILNREEASLFTGIAMEKTEEIFTRLKSLIKGIVIMTDGPRGAYVSDGVCSYHSGIFKERVLKSRTGAGDAFGSGFVSGLVRGMDMCESLRLASANATAVVEHIGAHEGSLTASAFKTQKRWKNFSIKNLD